LEVDQKYLGPREWSLGAEMDIPENLMNYNITLNGVWVRRTRSRRISQSVWSKQRLSRLLKNPCLIGGSLGAVLLVFAMINSILLHVMIADWNLLWYVGCWRDILGWQGHDSQRKSATDYENMYAEIEAALVDVSKYTHYHPDIWRRRGWNKETHSAFRPCSSTRLSFCQEVTSVIVAPYVLCVSLLAKC
jgi:hypothetical protein